MRPVLITTAMEARQRLGQGERGTLFTRSDTYIFFGSHSAVSYDFVLGVKEQQNMAVLFHRVAR